jgi:predicted nucleic acid-binding protein
VSPFVSFNFVLEFVPLFSFVWFSFDRRGAYDDYFEDGRLIIVAVVIGILLVVNDKRLLAARSRRAILYRDSQKDRDTCRHSIPRVRRH